MSNKLLEAVDHCLDKYSNIMDKLPPDGQKQTSRYLEIDCDHRQILNKLTYFSERTKPVKPDDGQRLKQMLIDSMDFADRKVQITDCLMDLVGDSIFKLNVNIKDIQMAQVSTNKSNKKPKRMLKWVPNYTEIDSDSGNDLLKEDTSKKNVNNIKRKIINMSNKQNSQIKANCNSPEAGTSQNIKAFTSSKTPRTKRAKRKIIHKNADSDSEIKPTYCICEKVSYGDMVCCDNDLCPIEWFHFKCVSLRKKPRGKWYCPRCRGTNSRKMKPKEIFFKELEEYNKRKEEDW